MDSLEPLLAVVFVLALLGGALFQLRKRGAAQFSFPRMSAPGVRRMEVLERLSLGSQHTLHLIRVDGRAMVVATAPTSCQFLCDVDRAEVNA